MATAADVISGSLRTIGVLASGESLPSNEANDGLTALNSMLALWSTEPLLVYTSAQDTGTLVNGQSAYTMGTGGNFNFTRPTNVQNVMIRITSGTTTYDLPVDIINQDQYADISVKSVPSSIPTKVFVQGTYPLETLNFWPQPNTAYQVLIFSLKLLGPIAATTTTVDLPPGYAEAIKYNLAVRLALEYGRPLDPVLVEFAAESKGAIKRLNDKPQLMVIDEAALGHQRAFNWLTGQ